MNEQPPKKRHSTQRHDLIMRMLRTDGLVTAQQIADDCSVSVMTIRRDFDALEEQGLLKRAHGGATLPGGVSTVAIDTIEPSITERDAQNREAKKMIATKAATMIAPHSTIAIDVGSTMYFLAQSIAEKPISVFTNSLKIAMSLVRRSPRVYVPGGEIHGTEPSIIGARAAEDLGRLMFDAVFIGASGVTVEGVYDYSLEDTEIKKAMIRRSQRTVLLIDSSKFGRMSLAMVSNFENINMIITDAPPPAHIAEVLQENEVDTLIARD